MRRLRRRVGDLRELVGGRIRRDGDVAHHHSVAGMTEPYIAMLSYSTKGSAKDAINKETGKSVYVIDKVKDAVSIAHEKYPELHVDGELQADAALMATI